MSYQSNSNSTIRLNDVVHGYIKTDGINYVCNNYHMIREEYYDMKLSQQLPPSKYNNKEEK